MSSSPTSFLPLDQLTSSANSPKPENPQRTAENLVPFSQTAPFDTDSVLRGAYIHIPFCFHKCHYCDFYSIVDNQDRQEAFVDRLIAELQVVSPRFTHPLRSLFVGGGTPTLLRPDLWLKLLRAIHTSLPLAPDAEFTIEANPETVTPELVEVLFPKRSAPHCARPNRISIGCQSFDTRHLKTLERWHDPASVARSINLLRGAGVSNINLDLIFAIPGQSLDDVQSDLDCALALHPQHISYYGLVYEPNTPMTARMQRGEFEPMENRIEAAMYEIVMNTLRDAGFIHYEVSNWAAPHNCVSSLNPPPPTPPSYAARHNVMYWNNESWWPFGPGAAGHVNGIRWKNAPRITSYLETSDWPPITDVEQLDEDGRIGERLMLGLRMMHGMRTDVVAQCLASGDRADTRRKAIETHTASGLLTIEDNHLRFTRSGLLLADTVLADLI